jgi:hypothetical protein
MRSKIAGVALICCCIALGAANACFAESAYPMKIESCDVKVDDGTAVFAFLYTKTAQLPDAFLLVVSVKSTAGEDTLLLNYRKDMRLIVVTKSGQALFNLDGYTEVVKGKKASITFKLPEEAGRIYNVTGFKGDITILVQEDKKEGGKDLGRYTLKGVVL